MQMATDTMFAFMGEFLELRTGNFDITDAHGCVVNSLKRCHKNEFVYSLRNSQN